MFYAQLMIHCTVKQGDFGQWGDFGQISNNKSNAINNDFCEEIYNHVYKILITERP